MYHYPFHLRDYLAKTRHLSHIEDLAYRRLLDAYYTKESKLPLDIDQVTRLILMREYRAEVEAVLNEFFIREEDGWLHARCEEEISKYRSKADRARIANHKRWGSDRDAGTDATIDVKSDATADPKSDATSDLKRNADRVTTTNHKPITNKPPKPPVEGFDAFWATYPNRSGKAVAEKAWTKLAPDDELRAAIMSALSKQKQSKQWTKDDGQFVPMASTWLNQKRFLDDEKAPVGGEIVWGDT